MHILVIPSWYPTHSSDINGVFFREQAVALARHGHRVGVICLQLKALRNWNPFTQGNRGLTEEVDAGVPTLQYHGVACFPRIPYANAMLEVYHGVRLYERYAKQYGSPDLVHVHSMLNAGVLARAIHRRYGIRYVVTEHSSGYARGSLTPVQLRTAARIARGAAKRFAVSRPLCTLLSNLLGDAAGDWIEMPNMVDSRFLAQPLTQRSKSDGAFRFITIALLSKKKGVHNLIRAFASAYPSELEVTLDIGGDGPERPGLERLAKDLGVSNRVRFLGALTRTQVARAIADADAFVLASRYETFGVVVVEALALGKPVIATRCGGPEAILRVQDGILVPIDDTGALSRAMRKCQAAANIYNAEEIRDNCRTRYGEEAVVSRLSDAYSAVFASGGRTFS